MSTVAAIDCGTNSVRMLVSSDGRDLARRMRIVRLGEGVDRTGRLDPAAIERTRVALRDFAAELSVLGAGEVRMVATSATRDATNRDDFLAMVRAVLGVEPAVISGEQEALLSYAGATAGLPGLVWPVLVADVGGGSTELVLGEAAGSAGVVAARSMNVGCVRLTERHLHSDPPRPPEVAAASRDVESGLVEAARTVHVGRATTFLGLAGSVTTVAAHALGLGCYDPNVIHGVRVAAADVFSACEELLGMTREQRAMLPYLHPGRVDVIGGGALIVAALLRAAGCPDMVVSEHDILDGIVASLGAPGEPPPGR